MNYNKLEREIFEVLEEAGEENLVALFNTVRKQESSTVDVGEFLTTLTRLIDFGLIEVAISRDPSTKLWLPSPPIEGKCQLRDSDNRFEWSESDQHWKWASEKPRIEILLTDTGIRTARSVLSGGNVEP